MDVYLFNAIRLTFSAVVLGIVVWIQKPQMLNRLSETVSVNRQVFHVAFFAFMTGFAYQLLFLWGINATSAGNTAIIMSGMPMWTAILAWAILRERLSRASWIGMLTAICGTLIVTLTKATGTSGDQSIVVGNLLVSMAAFSWALASVVSRPIMKNTSPVALAFWGVAGTLPLHIGLAWQTLPDAWSAMTQPRLMSAMLYSGIFSTGLAIAMWNYGVKQLGAAHAAGFQNLVPVIALIASWLLIGEVPFLLQLLGGILIIGGLIVMRVNSGTLK